MVAFGVEVGLCPCESASVVVSKKNVVRAMSVDPNSDSLLESLETNHEFPCEYTFKAIGGNPENFVREVLSVAAEELGVSGDPPHSVKQTPNGRHVSVTLAPVVESPQQVIKIYERLQALDDLVMLM